MSLQHSDGHRHLPVRLCDLKPEVLRHAALAAARQETDPTIVDLILHAAGASPSATGASISCRSRKYIGFGLANTR